ncbi:MAG TPA: DEAD/DEAH box helicase family protein [Candidatus Faecalibacterium gallistercoris]|uniref:DEAD/DEAH box helicase family protein n=1 Tax=Candidatus Faecalibacterium gallistercoris TaxID=2838579 RepID=A0A9D2JMJ7_9FIRM|nr:DEAD/DEAH box helicase family protein [Candidatus Faecalibacterium gallistercoris]
MELKSYQKEVLADLARYLELVVELQSPAKAYTAFWNERNVMVGLGGMPNYVNVLPGVPHVCAKVPTGGGKTYIAASAVRTIFDAMPQRRAKAVVWLVPSDAILTQTSRALQNPNHPYRQRLDVDFGGRVEVYSKEQALMGQNINPSSVTEQLSVFVLSYDSFRTSKKDGRKAYQQNGYLADFAKWMNDPSALLADTDETALIQVIRFLNPVVIVDESHHATSELSVEMLQNFNPCFVLDLTATPKKNSNIISFVDASQLKRANMVKLPVIVYNRKSQADVYADAIAIRAKLEAQAKREQEISGCYIRPIVLFQAQPRTKADSTTYEKIKKTLLDGGIPEQEIAIKTGDKDELKNVDLLSPDCPIRYIVTVNALKEGWDCPFAYVLATVANRTSVVDVEQILGRVLRLPYTRKNKSEVLNLSYVITSSADFHQTVEKVVDGLNSAGFSSRDYRAQDIEIPVLAAPTAEPEQLSMVQSPEKEPEIPDVSGSDLKTRFDVAKQEAERSNDETTVQSDPMLAQALEQNKAYEDEINQADNTALSQAPLEVRDKMNQFRMNAEFAEEASTLRFPQFTLETMPSLFSDSYEILEKEHLEGGFSLRDKDAHIDFNTVSAEMARVDVDDSKDSAAKAWLLSGSDSFYFREWFNVQPSEKRLSLCKGMIKGRLSKMNCINDRELDEYINRVIGTLTEDQLSELEQSPYPYVVKIQEKVKHLLSQHRCRTFERWLEQDKIVCRPNYALPTVISPTSFTTMVPKSLYTAEEDMDKYEFKVVWKLASLDNVKWWHRNISRLGFQINGPVHAYPDLIVMLQSGKILMVETKGDHLDNDESKEKAKIGDQWAKLAGKQYKYYMVFETKQPDYPGAYSLERFMDIVKGM